MTVHACANLLMFVALSCAEQSKTKTFIQYNYQLQPPPEPSDGMFHISILLFLTCPLEEQVCSERIQAEDRNNPAALQSKQC